MTDRDTYMQEQIDRGSSHDDGSAGEVIYMAMLDMGYPQRGDAAECLNEARRYLDAHRDGVYGRCPHTHPHQCVRCRLRDGHPGAHACDGYTDAPITQSFYWGETKGET